MGGGPPGFGGPPGGMAGMGMGGGPPMGGPPGGFDDGNNSTVMVYNLNSDRVNADRLFNLFCLYGNVSRVGFLVFFWFSIFSVFLVFLGFLEKSHFWFFDDFFVEDF